MPVVDTDPSHSDRPRGLEHASASGITLFTVMTVFFALSWLFVGLRGYVRVVMMKKVLIDDYLMFFAMLAYSAYSIIVIHNVFHGVMGGSPSSLSIPGIIVSLRAWYLCEVLYPAISAAIRTSVALLLLRIATARAHRWLIWGNMAVIWLMSLAYFFVLLLQCRPLAYYWTRVLGVEGTCVDLQSTGNASVAYSAVGALSDWILGLLPVAILWDVKLNKRTKATVAALLGMGIIAGAALIVRIPLIQTVQLSDDLLNNLKTSIDLAIWTVLEPSLGIIAGCTATLRPLFQGHGFGFGSLGRRTTKYYGGTARSRKSRAVGSSAYAWPGSRNRQSRMQRIEDGGSTGDTSMSDTVMVGPGSADHIALADSKFTSMVSSGPGKGGRGKSKVWDEERGMSLRSMSLRGYRKDGKDSKDRKDSAAGGGGGGGAPRLTPPSPGLIAVHTNIQVNVSSARRASEEKSEGSMGEGASLTLPVQGKEGV